MCLLKNLHNSLRVRQMVALETVDERLLERDTEIYCVLKNSNVREVNLWLQFVRSETCNCCSCCWRPRLTVKTGTSGVFQEGFVPFHRKKGRTERREVCAGRKSSTRGKKDKKNIQGNVCKKWNHGGGVYIQAVYEGRLRAHTWGLGTLTFSVIQLFCSLVSAVQRHHVWTWTVLENMLELLL